MAALDHIRNKLVNNTSFKNCGFFWHLLKYMDAVKVEIATEDTHAYCTFSAEMRFLSHYWSYVGLVTTEIFSFSQTFSWTTE